jgi:hypothetical protein
MDLSSEELHARERTTNRFEFFQAKAEERGCLLQVSRLRSGLEKNSWPEKEGGLKINMG